MSRIHLYIFCCCLLLSISGFGQEYLFNTRHLSVENGMLGRRVNGIVQDEQGFVWIGTNEGLNRFDGYRFEHFTKSTHGLNSNNIHRMGIDDVGDIWLTYWSDKFFIPETQILRPKTGELLSLEEKLGTLYKEEYRQLRVTNTANIGKISLSFPHDRVGLLICQNNRFLIPTAPTGYRLVNTQNDETIYFINENHSKILKYNLDGKLVDSININLDLETYYLNFTQNGNLMALGNKNANSFAYYKPKSSTTFQQILKVNGKEKFKHLQFGFWEDGKLYFEYQNQIIQFDASGLIEKQPRKLTFDKQNNVWIATTNGVIILSIKSQRFRQFLKDESSNKDVYDGRGIWANNETMFTFSGSGSYKYNLKDNSKTLILTSEAKITPHSVFKSKDNTLWVGTKRNPLLNLDIETGEILRKVVGTTHQIWSIFEDKNDRIWLGQNNKGLYYFEKDKMEQSQKYTQLNDFADIERGKITQIVADKRDNNYLWLSCQSGWYLLHLKNGITHRYWGRSDNKNFNIPADEIQFTYQDNNGDYWLATASSGLVKVTLNADQTVANTAQFTVEEGLSSNTIYAIYEDKNGLLWLSTNNGINSFNKKTTEV
ncbi:MAG: two-component regulator propeller domain-containing protein [Saprospiraceae bacterium]